MVAERWLSGLRHTPGKRAWLIPTVGSNPTLSAIFLILLHALHRSSKLLLEMRVTLWCHFLKVRS